MADPQRAVGQSSSDPIRNPPLPVTTSGEVCKLESGSYCFDTALPRGDSHTGQTFQCVFGDSSSAFREAFAVVSSMSGG